MPFDPPSFLDLAKIFGAPVALYLMARFITRRDKARDEAKAALDKAGADAVAKLDKAAGAAADERKLWREVRMANEKTLTDAVKKENTERMLWQLENAADLERVVSILKEFVQVQQQLAVVASTSQHHGTELQRLNLRMEESTKHLNDFIMRHVKPTNP